MAEAETPTVDLAPAPLRILLVEDDEFDVAVFGRAFRHSHIPCEIVRCRSGEEALDGLREAELELDLMVTDHQLPGLSGFDLCLALLDRFRSPARGAEGLLSHSGDTPPFALVLLTGVGSEEMAIRALRAGINDYIVKDASRKYLDLLPLVLPRVARRHRQRQRRAPPVRPVGLPATAPGAESAGVGLATCADVVRARGGRIWLEDEAGDTRVLHFSVPLAASEVVLWSAAGETFARDTEPAAGDAGGAAADPAAASWPAQEHLRHALIVHPNPIVSFVARRTAERSGFRVAAVVDGCKAIEALEREFFDLMLIALDMPGLGGLETTRRIRANAGGSGALLPILALGAAAGDEARWRAAGMDGAVASPVSDHSLKAAFARLG